MVEKIHGKGITAFSVNNWYQVCNCKTNGSLWRRW